MALTADADAFILVSGVPGLEFADLAAVVDLFTARARRQTHVDGAAALVAVAEQRAPAAHDGHRVRG